MFNKYPTPIPPRRGRPSREQAAEKHRHLLRLAQQSFLARGYAGTTIDQIASASGISKGTIYARHGGKEELFRAVTRLACQAPEQALAKVETADRAPSAVLADFIAVLLAQARDPESLAFFRLVMFESQRFPEVAHQAYEASLETLAPLIAYLRHLHQQGWIDTLDPDATAMDLVNLCSGGYRFLLQPALIEPAESDAERLLRLFLRGIALQPAEAPEHTAGQHRR